MKALLLGLVAVVLSWPFAIPAQAIPITFFQGYQSTGAMLVRTGNPGDVFRVGVLSLNFDPAGFSAAEAQTVYQALRSLLAGGTITSVSPTEIAGAGLTVTQVIELVQQLYLNDFSISEFYVLNVYRRQPSGIGIDLYLFFAPNDFRYAVTLQF
jgi:hypothetical protein